MFRLTCLMLVLWSTAAFAQNQPTPEQTIPHRFEVNLFGGGSFFEQAPDPFRTKLVNGGIVGIHFANNLWSHVSIEPSFNLYGVNNLRFNRNGSELGLGSRVFAVAVNPVFHFTNRLSRFRPFVTIGLGENVYFPTRDAKQQVRSMTDPVLAGSLSQLDTSTLLTLNYGLGVKMRFRKDGPVGLRFDVRGLRSDNPKFNLSRAAFPGAISVTDSVLNGIQATIGINFWFGKADRPTIVTVPGPERVVERLVDRSAIVVSQIQGTAEACGGTEVPLSVTVSAPSTVSYQWSLNGTNVGTNQNTYTATLPEAGGNQTIALRITDTSTTGAATPVTMNYVVRARPYVRPSARVAVGANDIPAGQTVNVTAVGQGDCGGPLTYSWAASEGRITGNNAQATFDSSTVAFPAASSQDQIKPITLTATVRDQRGTSATGTATVNVKKAVETVRMPDVMFMANSSRVNNCGKRVLLDEVIPRLRALGNNYAVVLVGHRDATDRNNNIDRDRAYNAGRVLVSGADTQTRVEKQRIKVDWTGTTAGSASEPGLCGTSAGPDGGNRRVEVWLVPNNQMPGSVQNARSLPPNIR